MKLHSPKRVTSFYESFSDLIFCTLCLFILIIVVLVLQVGKAQDELEEKVKTVVVPNQFVGGATDTLIYTALVRIGGEPHMVFAPSDHSVNMSVVRVSEEDQLEIVRNLRNGHYMIRPVEELRALLSGVGNSTQGITSQLFSHMVQAYLELEKNQPRKLEGLREDNEVFETMMGEYEKREFRDWLQVKPSWDWHSRWVQSWAPLKALQPEGSFVRFSLAPDTPETAFDREKWREAARLMVGELELTLVEFIALMGSIKPGYGFVLEYVDGAGLPIPPPAIVKEEVLDQVGYTGRVLSKAGSRELAEVERSEG